MLIRFLTDCGGSRTIRKRALNAVLVLTGILMLLYIGYGLTHPEKPKGRAQRINSVNSAPRITLILSNPVAPPNIPNTKMR
jgi:hypothetical protein